MSSVSVRLDQDFVNSARKAAKSEFRTLQSQIEFWGTVGRAAIDNPDLPVDFIVNSLMAMAEAKEDSTDFVPKSKKR